MLNLDILHVAAGFLALGTLSYVAGWALSWRGIPVFLENPIHMAVVRMIHGILVFVPVLLVMFAILPPPYALPGLTGVILVAASLKLAKHPEGIRGWFRHPVSRVLKGVFTGVRRHPMAIVLAGLSFAYFSWVLVTNRWPNIGDVLLLHGPVTASLSSGGYPAVAERLWFFYPVGFHTTPASLVPALGIYPAEAVFLFGGFLAALLPLLMYVLARSMGAGPFLSLVAFTAAFVVHPSGHLEKWILGPFFNGPYPNLLGYIVVVLILLHLSRRALESPHNTGFSGYAKPALFYSGILVLIYPSFVVPIILHLLLLGSVSLLHRRGIWASLFENPRARMGFIAASLAATLIIITLLYTTELSGLIGRVYPPAHPAYVLAPEFFFDNITGIVILVGAGISAFAVLNRRAKGVELFYLVLLALMLLSLHDLLYGLIWVMLPSRAIIILGILAWVLLAREIQTLLNKFHGRMRASDGSSRFRRAQLAAKWGPVTAAILILTAQAVATGPMTPLFTAHRSGWLSRVPSFSSDFGAAEWFAENADSTDLILSDGSWMSRYAVSLKPLRLTHNLPFEVLERTSWEALNRIWSAPLDEEYIRQALNEYGVQYVLITSEWGAYGRVENEYRAKAFQPGEYVEIFSSYSFLKVEYAAENTRIFRVQHDVLQSFVPISG